MPVKDASVNSEPLILADDDETGVAAADAR